LPVYVDAENRARGPINRDRADPLKIDLSRKISQRTAGRFPPRGRMLGDQSVIIERRRRRGRCERGAAPIRVYRRGADGRGADVYAQGEITHCRSNALRRPKPNE
jgi:hypothetical protein